MRIYRKKSTGLSESIERDCAYSHILGKILSPFQEREGIQLCDVSQSNIHSDPTFRVVFKLPKKQTLKEAEMDIEAFFSCFQNSEEYKQRLLAQVGRYTNPHASFDSPLMQIGGELDSTFRLTGVKSYMRIHDLNFDVPMAGTMKAGFEQLGKRICCGGYVPIFMGINDNGGEMEEKLYFISKSIGLRNRRVLENLTALCRELGWDTVLPEEQLVHLHEMHLYAEGLAVPLQSDTYRMYFTEFRDAP